MIADNLHYYTKSGCDVESETLSSSYIKSIHLDCILHAFLPICDFVTSCIVHLEELGS